MLPFNVYEDIYPSRRSTLFSNRGMVCTSIPQASAAGAEILSKGGNAIDAAVAIAAALPLLEPTSNSIGSDAFAIVWTNGEIFALNGSGASPRALNADAVRCAGFTKVPISGWLSVTVPGAPSAWAELNRRFGSMSLGKLFAPAIKYAEHGFPLSTNTAKMWIKETPRFAYEYKHNPELYQPWINTYTKEGVPYMAGEIFKCPEYADTLRELARTNCESFYTGELMRKMVAFSRATGGFLSEEDFTSHRCEWVRPLSSSYKGFDVFEMPPNGHGITVLMALNILSGLKLGESKDSPQTWHSMIEALKLAFTDAKAFVADPRAMRTKVSDMLSPEYAAIRRSLISENAISPRVGNPSCGDTVYFCTADSNGNMVSFIQSCYQVFGSGVTIPGTGITMQDRAANFSLDPASDNFLEGNKRPYHTIIPGFLAKDGRPIGPFGVMGGFMQPQGHLQVLVNMIDYGMNPQQALDAPRFQWIGEKRIQLESSVPQHIIDDLNRRGHEIEIIRDNIDMGRGQIIYRLPNGVLAGGTEPRCDGCIALL